MQTGQQALEKQLAANGQTLTSVAKFSGRVTIDGQTPAVAKQGQMLLVMLYDPTDPPSRQHPIQRANVDKNGEFEFQTYNKGDGVKEGSYIVLFAAFKPKGHGAFGGPDGLENLYNDPDQNEKNPDFKITVKRPGRTDYRFDLAVAGRQPVESPGAHAVTKIDRAG